MTILRLTIEDLIGSLPTGQQDIVTLRIEGNEVKTIATQTGRSKRSVERILQRFREGLRSQLEKGG